MDNNGSEMDNNFIHEWSADDHRLYATWLEEMHSSDWYTSACAIQWIEVVWEKQVHPTEVGSYMHDEQERL